MKMRQSGFFLSRLAFLREWLASLPLALHRDQPPARTASPSEYLRHVSLAAARHPAGSGEAALYFAAEGQPARKKPALTPISLAICLCSTWSAAYAGTPAVDQTNYQLGFASGDNRTAHGGDSGTAGINGAVNFPIVSYLGAMVSGTYSRTRLSPYFSSQGTALGKSDCGYKDRAVAAGLFVRDPAYGRLGVSDQVGQLTASCGTIFPATDSRRLNTRTVSADGEYYFSRLTLSVARSRTELEGGTRIEAATYGAGLYPSRALELALSAGGLDDRDTYSIAAIYQPEFLEDSASAFIRFTEQRRPNDSHFIYVGFEYYFGTRVDLLTRDRQYR